MKRALLIAALLSASACQKATFLGPTPPNTPAPVPLVVNPLAAFVSCVSSHLTMNCRLQLLLNGNVYTSHLSQSSWEWGDGTTSTSGITATHVYSTFDIFQFEATVTTDDGHTAQVRGTTQLQ